MYEPLVPCPGCRRHVRAADGACPFCSAAIDSTRIAPDARTRLSRGALFAVAAASVAIAGCSSDDTKTSTTDSGVVDTGGPAPAYGAPADTGSTSDSMDDTGGPVAAYGAPPDTGAVDDTGGGMPKYGAPPPPDGGAD
ncbi:MAG: hypothetical protein ACXVEF_33775 [Polyangiales bacterium]